MSNLPENDYSDHAAQTNYYAFVLTVIIIEVYYARTIIQYPCSIACCNFSAPADRGLFIAQRLHEQSRGHRYLRFPPPISTINKQK